LEAIETEKVHDYDIITLLQKALQKKFEELEKSGDNHYNVMSLKVEIVKSTLVPQGWFICEDDNDSTTYANRFTNEVKFRGESFDDDHLDRLHELHRLINIVLQNSSHVPNAQWSSPLDKALVELQLKDLVRRRRLAATPFQKLQMLLDLE